MNNRDSMLELVKSHPSGLRELIEKYGTTTSYEIAGPLLGVLIQLRQEGLVPVDDVNSALFGLVRTLHVWEMDPWAPEGLLNTLQRALFDRPLPGDTDRFALAELIERAAAQDERTMGCRLEILSLSTLNICSALANWGELVPVLALRPGALESVTGHIGGNEAAFLGG